MTMADCGTIKVNRRMELSLTSRKIGCVTGDEEIVLANGFLFKVAGICDGYFQTIEKAIHAEQGLMSRSDFKSPKQHDKR